MALNTAQPEQGDSRKSRLEDRVYSGLLDDIRLGAFRLGQRLPSEADLAAQYGCSRPVIRAALAKLRESGLIVSRQGAGSFVSSGHPDEKSGFAPLHSIDDIAEYFRFRRMIEAETVQNAARLAGPGDIASLRGLIDRMDELSDSGASTVDTDIVFHRTIAEMSGSRFLAETMDMLAPNWKFVGRFVTSLSQTGSLSRQRDMNSEHRLIVDAIGSGDAEAARVAMTRHIEGSERRVFKGV